MLTNAAGWGCTRSGDLRGPTGATVPLSPRYILGPQPLKPEGRGAYGALASPRGSAGKAAMPG